MRTWFTSDLHLGHKRIIELGDGRPWDSIEEHDAALIGNINSVVPETGRLVVLGDICMGKLDESLPKLELIRAAEIVLVPGNHDRWSAAYHHKGDEAQVAEKREAFRVRYVRDERFYVVEDEGVHGLYNLTLDRSHLASPLNRCNFSHYPYEGDSREDGERYSELRMVDDGRPLICGHVHSSWKISRKQYNVGVDVNDWKPVSTEVLEDWVKSLDTSDQVG